ncbi:hypothetical protein [Streptomyces litchfieldiae]|uniref:Secreted protein n=1 Tax=Streptomyces litchfieldiae TaxID=3075543 RepID=A0ABU2MX10_9ACTN|nr:hypothetical protein [Streptomyces sp. DSM 44938]MDT0346188.1 hypothetical protein [Streptomyces sp. DSM 44938]
MAKKVPPAQRRQAKQRAGKAAEKGREASAVLAAGAALTVALPPVAAILGAASGLFFLYSTYAQKLAKDPPRDDFDEVWLSEAQFNGNAVVDTDPERMIQILAVHQAIAAERLWATLVALERYDGALAAGAGGQAEAQATAAQRNAEGAVIAHDMILRVRPEVNDAWSLLVQENELDWNSIALGDMQQQYRESYGHPPAFVAFPLQRVLTAMINGADGLLEPFPDPDFPHPVLEAAGVPAEPSLLIDDVYRDELEELSTALRELVVEEE